MFSLPSFITSLMSHFFRLKTSSMFRAPNTTEGSLPCTVNRGKPHKWRIKPWQQVLEEPIYRWTQWIFTFGGAQFGLHQPFMMKLGFTTGCINQLEFDAAKRPRRRGTRPHRRVWRTRNSRDESNLRIIIMYILFMCIYIYTYTYIYIIIYIYIRANN